MNRLDFEVKGQNHRKTKYFQKNCGRHILQTACGNCPKVIS